MADIFNVNELNTEINQTNLSYQHIIFCQLSLPYKNPGNETREWTAQQGNIRLLLKAGKALHPQTKTFKPLGLPYGPKSRLILAHINTQAIIKQTPVLACWKQLDRFREAARNEFRGTHHPCREGSAGAPGRRRSSPGNHQGPGAHRNHQDNHRLRLELWFQKDLKNRVLWPREVTLSQEYFESLQRHAVPLAEDALGKLADSALALDIYAWLAQRLRRVPPRERHLVPWKALHRQFGGAAYRRPRTFKENFKKQRKEP